jgi:hypothetical protein
MKATASAYSEVTRASLEKMDAYRGAMNTCPEKTKAEIDVDRKKMKAHR